LETAKAACTARPGNDKTINVITTQDGTRIYYKDWGTGQPVVLSHGWPLNADAWQSQMVFLAQNGYRTIATTAAATAARASLLVATIWTPTLE
jgi:non-heme chloroperoxidase